MTEATVLLSRDANVATITLNRPAARNALDTSTKVALREALEEVAADAAVRCVVVSGTGQAFCAGQDLKEHQAMLAAGDLDALWRTVPEHYNVIATLLATMDKPVIAGVNGVAAGAGAALAFLADYRLVAASAGINVAFARIGLSCDTGTSWSLPRLVGPTRAMELLLTGRTVRAEEALAIGLVDRLVPAAEVLEAAVAWAGQFTKAAAYALRAAKESIDRGLEVDLETGLEIERAQFAALFATADRTTGMNSFIESGPGKARFEGR